MTETVPRRRRSWLPLIPATILALSALALAIPAYAGGGGCYSQPATDGSGVAIEIKNFCFSPTVLHVEAGQKVTWVNRDPVQHTVTGTAQSFGGYGSIEQDKGVSYKFTTNGVYTYFCALHPGMSAAIVVGDGSGKGPATAGSSVIPLPAAQTAVRTAVVKSSPSTGALVAVGLVALLLGAAGGYLLGWPLRRRAL